MFSPEEIHGLWIALGILSVVIVIMGLCGELSAKPGDSEGDG